MGELGSFVPDNLIGGDKNLIGEEVTIQSGNSLKRGTVLGKVTVDVPSTGTADAGNTGDGTCTSVEGRRRTRKGVYTLECVTAEADGGVFSVTTPNGDRLADAVVGEEYDGEHIAFLLNDGTSDFAVGDTFTITVAVGSRECVAVDSSNSNGSQNPYAVLSEDVDATDEAKRSIGYLEGEFNERALIFGGDDNVETHREAMRDLGMICVASQSTGS